MELSWASRKWAPMTPIFIAATYNNYVAQNPQVWVHDRTLPEPHFLWLSWIAPPAHLTHATRLRTHDWEWRRTRALNARNETSHFQRLACRTTTVIAGRTNFPHPLCILVASAIYLPR